MTKFTSVTPQQDDVLFVAFGKLNEKHDKKTQYLVKEGETIEGVVLECKDTEKNYKKILKVNAKGVDKPLLILGKTNLVEKLNAGEVKEGDLIRLTFTGIVKTNKGYNCYTFELAVAQA